MPNKDKSTLNNAILEELSSLGDATALNGAVIPMLTQPPTVYWKIGNEGNFFAMNVDSITGDKALNGKVIEPTIIFRDEKDDKVIKLENPLFIPLHNSTIWEKYQEATGDTVTLCASTTSRNGNGVFRYPQLDVVEKVIYETGEKLHSKSQMYALLTADVAVKGSDKPSPLFKNKLVRVCYNGQVKRESFEEIFKDLTLVTTTINNELKKHKLSPINFSNLQFGIDTCARMAGGKRNIGFKLKGAKSEYSFEEAYNTFVVDKDTLINKVVPALEQVQEFVVETEIHKVIACQAFLDKTGTFPKNADAVQQVLSGNTDSLLIEHDNDIALEVDNNFDDDVPM